LRREDYYRAVQQKTVNARRADPNDPAFDAERAVAYYVQNGNTDEAAWLIFLMTHFARPAGTGWLRLKDVYGQLGQGTWDWATVRANPAAFERWLSAHWRQIRGKFGNHRKYESLRPNAKRPMGTVVRDYIRWIGPAGHAAFFTSLSSQGSNDLFDSLYRGMSVHSFGRLARFDYAMLIGRYGIAPVVPRSAYLNGATGPRSGVTLLFTGQPKGGPSTSRLQGMLNDLDEDLNVGMAVLEDALCNWQKSPARFVHYIG
jgi:hypothetical protein